MLLGFAPPDGQFHAPNEWMWMANYETGIRTIARYWDEVSKLESDLRPGARSGQPEPACDGALRQTGERTCAVWMSVRAASRCYDAETLLSD